MSSTPVILVGCGAVSQQFYLPTLRTLARRNELSVAALVDPSAAARQVLAREFPEAQQHGDLADVRAPDGSLAIVATPPRFHREQTLAAVRRGWHVLCEKPMASSAAECTEMIAAAAAAQRLLAVGLYKRFFPSSQYLKSILAGGQLGQLAQYRISEGGPFKWPAATPSFFNKAQTPGGVLLDIGVHVFDLLIWLLGEPVSFRYLDDAMGGLETNSHVELEHLGGARGKVHLSRDWATPNEYHFVFERGEITWKVNDANGLSLHLAGTPSALRAQLLRSSSAATPAQPEWTNPQSFIRQLQNVLQAARGEASLLIPGEEGMRSLRFIESCYRNRSWLEHPWLSEAEARRARELAGT